MKNIRGLIRSLSAVTLATSIVFSGFSVFAAKVEIDGKAVSFPDQQPIVVDGSPLIPVRGVFEQLGYTVNWNPTTGVATITKGDKTVIIKERESTFTTNGTTYNVSLRIAGNRLMIPFKMLLESVGCSAEWDKSKDTVIVSTIGVANTSTAQNSTQQPATSNSSSGNYSIGNLIQRLDELEIEEEEEYQRQLREYEIALKEYEINLAEYNRNTNDYKEAVARYREKSKEHDERVLSGYYNREPHLIELLRPIEGNVSTLV